MMRKLAIAVALASTVAATPALAREDAWYIGVEGGPSLVENQNLEINNVKNAGKINFKTGYDLDGIIGYDFGGFRLESEVAYKAASTDGYQSTVVTPFSVSSGVAPPGVFPGASGQTNALSFMVNGLLDFGDDDGLQGFVGGGVGIARVKDKVKIWNTLGAAPFLNDSDTGLAWQALAGVRAPLAGNWDVGLKYRFFNAPGVDLVDKIGRTVETRFRSHSLLGSLIYNFGGEEAAPVPVAPPMPEVVPVPEPMPVPEPAPVAVCTPGPYIVFFDHNKSDITAEAASILDNAVAAYGNCGSAQVQLSGHADKSGNPAYNVKLSERRNAAVRAYLNGRGIADGNIAMQAFGESAPLVETADGVRELQNRRVEVLYRN